MNGWNNHYVLYEIAREKHRDLLKEADEIRRSRKKAPEGRAHLQTTIKWVAVLAIILIATLVVLQTLPANILMG